MSSNSDLNTNTELAFRLIDDAKAADGSAPQAMAWVLRTLHDAYRTQGGMRIPGKNGEASQTMPLPSWASLLAGGESKSLFVSAVVHSIGIASPKAAKEETFKQRGARLDVTNADKRHIRLIANSIPFAAALETRGIPMTAYGKARISGKEYPVWRVPARSLAMKGWALLGDEAENPGTLRALDGKSILAQCKNKDGDWRPVQNAVASVQQFIRATFGTKDKVKGADENKSDAGKVKLSNGTVLSEDFATLVLATSKALADDKGEGVVRLADLTKPVRDALGAIAAFYADALEAQTQERNAKLAAQKAEADRVKAAKAQAKEVNAKKAKETRAKVLAETKAAKLAEVDAARVALAEAAALPEDDTMRASMIHAAQQRLTHAEAAAGIAA